MITPYKYRFTLGKNTPRTPDGNYIVQFDGREIKTTNREIEFGVDREITLEEFNERVKGTQGIEAVRGIFKDSLKIELNKFLEWVGNNYTVDEGHENGWTKDGAVTSTASVVVDYLDKQTLSLN
jgi:hypothetical protein